MLIGGISFGKVSQATELPLDKSTSTKKTNNHTITRELFPHQITTTALEEIGAQIHTTDSSYETKKPKPNNHPDARAQTTKSMDVDAKYIILAKPCGCSFLRLLKRKALKFF